MNKKDIISFILIVIVVIAAVLFVDYVSRTGLYNEPEKIEFECYKHNYTERNMEPMTVYPIFYNQSGFAVIDGHGGGLIRIFTDCLESQAMIDNKTVWCNGTVDVCEELYNREDLI